MRGTEVKKTLTLEDKVDELFEVRQSIKSLQDKEKSLKSDITEELTKIEKNEVTTTKTKLTITTKNTEKFNEEAFVNSLLLDVEDGKFDESVKESVLEQKYIIKEAELSKAVQDDIISVDYVSKFNTVTQSKVVNTKKV